MPNVSFEVEDSFCSHVMVVLILEKNILMNSTFAVYNQYNIQAKLIFPVSLYMYCMKGYLIEILIKPRVEKRKSGHTTPMNVPSMDDIMYSVIDHTQKETL